jgi:hypothetical protein
MAVPPTRAHSKSETSSGATAPDPTSGRQPTPPAVRRPSRRLHPQSGLGKAPASAANLAPNLNSSAGRPEFDRPLVRPINGVDSDRLGKFTLGRYEHVQTDSRGAKLSKLSVCAQSLEEWPAFQSTGHGDPQPEPYEAWSGVLSFMAPETRAPQTRKDARQPQRQTVTYEWVQERMQEQAQTLPWRIETKVPVPVEIDAMLASLQNAGMDGFLEFCTKHSESLPGMRDSQGRPILVALVQAAVAGRRAGRAHAALAGTKKYTLDFLLDTPPGANKGGDTQACFASQAIEVLLRSDKVAAHLRAKCLWGCNALIHCASLGDPTLVLRLLAVSDALSVEQLRLRAPDGHALMTAVVARHTATAAALLRNPAWATIQLAGTPKRGNLLMMLLQEGLSLAAQTLIEAALAVPPHDQGALIFSLAGKVDAHGQRPIDLARAQGKPGIVEMLTPWSPPLKR